jgi:hypothetical protein
VWLGDEKVAEEGFQMLAGGKDSSGSQPRRPAGAATR